MNGVTFTMQTQYKPKLKGHSIDFMCQTQFTIQVEYCENSKTI